MFFREFDIDYFNRSGSVYFILEVGEIWLGGVSGLDFGWWKK